MAKKYSFGSMLFFGAAAAAVAGVAAYRHHAELKKVVEEIAEELEDEGLFDVDLTAEEDGEDEKIVHIVPNPAKVEAEKPAGEAEEVEGDEEDFVDGGEEPSGEKDPQPPEEPIPE